MREIKFRAWEKDLKEIIPVDDINFQRRQVNTQHVWRFFEEVELMQYTGLKDKNGKEIYEGDILTSLSYGANHKRIVKFGEYEQDGSGGEYNPSKCIGFYSEAIALQANEYGESYLYDFDLKTSLLELKDIEVVGNIYENSELLEVNQ